MDGIREHEIERRLAEIEKSLGRILHILRHNNHPTLHAFQTGVPTMAIGSINAGSTGQFAVVLNWPAGVTQPASYAPTFTATSPDPLITITPATTDATNGAVPLAQQVVATVAINDTNTSGAVSFSALGTDGVTVLTSNAVTFAIVPAPPPPPVEPTLVASQVA